MGWSRVLEDAVGSLWLISATVARRDACVGLTVSRSLWLRSLELCRCVCNFAHGLLNGI